MIAIIPSIYLLIKRKIFKIKQKKLKPWYSTIIPEKLLKSTLKDEKILYNSAKISNTKALVYLISISYVVVLSLSTFLLLYIADIFDIFIFIIIAIVAGPTIGFFFYTTEQENKYLIITNKRILIYHKQASKSEKVNYFKINSLRGVIFRKRFLDKKGDAGTIDLITKHKNPRRITINNIKDISELQIIVESILYEYGNVKEKWNQMKENPFFQLPQSYKISQKRLKANRKSQMHYLIINIFILIICFVIGLIITFYITLESKITQIIITGIYFFCIFMIIILSTQIIIMKKRSSENESRLIINQNYIEYRSNKNFFQIPIQESITLNYYESNIFVSRKNSVNYDFIKIFKSFNSKSIIKFGPFEELPKLLTFLFVHFVIWKCKHGFLLSKNQLNHLKSKPQDDILNEIKKEHHKEGIRAIKIRESIRTSKNQETYQQNFDNYKNFQPYFDPDEYLVHHAKPNINFPNVNLKTTRIEIISGISYCILIFVFLTFLVMPTPFLPILSLVMLIISVLGAFTLCLFGSGNYLKIKENKDSIYVLTNKKIIIKRQEAYYPIIFTNIYSITRNENNNKTYNIEFHLKKPLVTIPNLIKYFISISNLPIENDFYDKMIFLLKLEFIKNIIDNMFFLFRK